MTKATTNGNLNEIRDCWIKIPGGGMIKLNSLPDISDGKQAIYNSETIMGRSTPLYTYSHSGDRVINMQLHFFLTKEGDATKNLNYLKWISSATYPRIGNSAPYTPPPICTINCGKLIAEEPICAILQSYNVRFPTEVAWYEEDGTYCPFRFDVDTSWLAVYPSSDLPYQDRIVKYGA